MFELKKRQKLLAFSTNFKQGQKKIYYQDIHCVIRTLITPQKMNKNDTVL